MMTRLIFLLKNYLLIDGSPLQEITMREVELLRNEIGHEYSVYFANKFSSPFITNVVEQMENDGVTDCICLILNLNILFIQLWVMNVF